MNNRRNTEYLYIGQVQELQPRLHQAMSIAVLQLAKYLPSAIALSSIRLPLLLSKVKHLGVSLRLFLSFFHAVTVL